jgi:hypothetical protein
MRLTINLDMDNAAFFDNDPNDEVRSCLARIAYKLDTLPFDEEGISQNVLDSNGNVTGTWKVRS